MNVSANNEKESNKKKSEESSFEFGLQPREREVKTLEVTEAVEMEIYAVNRDNEKKN
jgi:hypothetical protein